MLLTARCTPDGLWRPHHTLGRRGLERLAGCQRAGHAAVERRPLGGAEGGQVAALRGGAQPARHARQQQEQEQEQAAAVR